MRVSFISLLVLLPLYVAAVPIVVPSNSRKIALKKRSNLVKKGVVDLDALQNHVARVTSKINRGFEAYQKNTGSAHPNARNSSTTKRSTGSVSLTDDTEELWYGTISVGTPSTDYTVDFDTGSSDLFLPGSDCDSTCSGHTIYDPSSSSTSSDVGSTFSLSYGDGSTVSGEQYTDTVTIGGLTATNQTLGAASQYSSGFEIDEFPADGLMGMAFQSISDYDASPVFQSLISADETSSGEFGFTLLETGSELYLGGVDSSKFSGDLTYTSVTQEGYWQISVDGLTVGSDSVLSSIDAIVDTGTTLLIGDSESVASVYEQISGSQSMGEGYYTIPCDSVPDDVALTIGGTSFTISSDTFNLGQVSENSDDCIGGLYAEDDLGFWILGDVFLRNVYTSFDVDNSQVGFAAIASNSSSSSNSTTSSTTSTSTGTTTTKTSRSSSTSSSSVTSGSTRSDNPTTTSSTGSASTTGFTSSNGSSNGTDSTTGSTGSTSGSGDPFSSGTGSTSTGSGTGSSGTGSGSSNSTESSDSVGTTGSTDSTVSSDPFGGSTGSGTDSNSNSTGSSSTSSSDTGSGFGTDSGSGSDSSSGSFGSFGSSSSSTSTGDGFSFGGSLGST